jgi:hypothetical protein
MQRNGLLLPLGALVMAGLLAGLLAWDFRRAWEVKQAQLAAIAPATLDGTIAEGEYLHSYYDEETGMEIHWTIVGEEIYLALRCPSRGWGSIGLGGEGPMMKDSDIIIAYIDEAGVHSQDSFGIDMIKHAPDVELGGRDDIIALAGSEDEAGMTIELHRALETGDPYDQPITPGSLRILLAHANSDDFVSYHTSRSTVMLELVAEEGP